MSLELISEIISISFSPFSLSVFPVCTKSTIQSDNPKTGAISIAPFKISRSKSFDLDEKYFFVNSGYFEATLIFF